MSETGKEPRPCTLRRNKTQFITIEVLLRHGADVEAMDEAGRSPLQIALVALNSASVVVLIRHGANVERVAQDAQEICLLHLVCYENIEKAARILLECGFDPEAIDGAGATALHVGIRWHGNDFLPTAKTLLEYGVNINAVNGRGNTPMALGSMRNNCEVVEWLLQNGAYASPRDRKGTTPLHWACITANVKMVRDLLRHGAEISVKVENLGHTPLHAVARGWRWLEPPGAHPGGDGREEAEVNDSQSLESGDDTNSSSGQAGCEGTGMASAEDMEKSREMEEEACAIAKLLFDAGAWAFASAVDCIGRTPGDIAREGGWERLEEFLNTYEVCVRPGPGESHFDMHEH